MILYGREAIRFLGALCVTTGLFFTTDADDFFPDISSLYDNMSNNDDIPNVNAT
jgi:hypothetical protein